MGKHGDMSFTNEKPKFSPSLPQNSPAEINGSNEALAELVRTYSFSVHSNNYKFTSKGYIFSFYITVTRKKKTLVIQEKRRKRVKRSYGSHCRRNLMITDGDAGPPACPIHIGGSSRAVIIGVHN